MGTNPRMRFMARKKANHRMGMFPGMDMDFFTMLPSIVWDRIPSYTAFWMIWPDIQRRAGFLRIPDTETSNSVK